MYTIHTMHLIMKIDKINKAHNADGNITIYHAKNLAIKSFINIYYID